jgi:hypothetical protein
MSTVVSRPARKPEVPVNVDCCEWMQRLIEDILAGRMPPDPFELEEMLASQIREEWERTESTRL